MPLRMNALDQRILFNWANVQSFPSIGVNPPKPGEEVRTIGGGRPERAIVRRDTFVAQIAGFSQTVDTVSLQWMMVVHTVARRVEEENPTVKLHVPITWFGHISHDEYRAALMWATECLLHPTVGEIRRQPFIYQYFSTLLWQTVSFAETLPACYYDSTYIEYLWNSSKSDGTVMVPSHAYPQRSSRWAFEVTNHGGNPDVLRVDIQAPNSHQFSCVTIVPLNTLPPRRRSCTIARRRLVIERIKAYIRALEEDSISGQYAH